jgi:hypothetical protein
MTKWIKWGVIGVAGFFLIGGFLFGPELFSYVRSSAKMTRDKVKDAVPIDFELQRAQCLLDEIMPEIHANIQMIAQEEVELTNLKKEIGDNVKSIASQKERVVKLRAALEENKDAYVFGNKTFGRQDVTDELAAQFENLREAEQVLAGKEKLLTTREKSLAAGIQLLEKTKSQKRLLAAKIETLEGQHRLIKATAVGSGITIDNSKLAQTEKLIGQIKKRLDVAERVLTHESKFTQTLIVDQVTDKEVMSQVDDYLNKKTQTAQTVQPEANSTTGNL